MKCIKGGKGDHPEKRGGSISQTSRYMIFSLP